MQGGPPRLHRQGPGDLYRAKVRDLLRQGPGAILKLRSSESSRLASSRHSALKGPPLRSHPSDILFLLMILLLLCYDNILIDDTSFSEIQGHDT